MKPPCTERYARWCERTGVNHPLLLDLETGRTHQIRIHMAQIGHPLLGDTLYYPSYQGQMKRAALHAALITMPHPFSGKPLRFEAPLPEDMKELL